MHFNATKCNIMWTARTPHNLSRSYSLGNHILKQVDYVMM